MLEQEDILKDLKSLVSDNIIKVNGPLKYCAYMKTGGNADLYLSSIENEQVQTIARYAQEHQLLVIYLGNGLNIIIREGGIRGIVISLLSFNHTNISDDAIIARSGAAIVDVSKAARDYVPAGLESACGIPGSVGGAAYVSVGAYGGEIKDCIDYALRVNEHGDLIRLTKEQLHLDYRNSVVQKQHLVVPGTTSTLGPGNSDKIQTRVDDPTERRGSKQPFEYPSCGSVFQRPPGHFAGKLTQDSNLQGHHIGGAEVSTKHAGFMANVDNGTTTDYESSTHYVQKVVKEKFDVESHREVRIISEYPKSE